MIIYDILDEKEINEQIIIRQFKKSHYYDLLKKAYDSLDEKILFKSRIHGIGHIRRVILFSALNSFLNKLDYMDTQILLKASSYHDIGRVNDGYDTIHGKRSARKLKDLTDFDSEDLKICEFVVEYHSQKDSLIDEIFETYTIENKKRAYFLAKLFKDCDGLDRVRINDLDTNFLRNESSLKLVDLSYMIYSYFS